MKRNQNVVPIGILSSDTMRADDVGDAIASELSRLRLSREHRKLVNEWNRALAAEYDEGSRPNVLGDAPDLQELCSELEQAIDDYLPPCTYYGSAEGDGACFGVWPILDADNLPKYPAGESPNGSGDCYEVADHGNVSCGRRLKDGRWIEYWSVV